MVVTGCSVDMTWNSTGPELLNNMDICHIIPLEQAMAKVRCRKARHECERPSCRLGWGDWSGAVLLSVNVQHALCSHILQLYLGVYLQAMAY